MNIVYREDTYDDKAMENLAKSKAACNCRLQFGRCDKSQCANCQREQDWNACAAQMSPYDRNRMMHKVSEYYGAYSSDPTNWGNYEAVVKYELFDVLVKPAIIIGTFILLAWLGCMVVNASPVPNYISEYNLGRQVTAQTSDHVVAVINKVRRTVRDVDNDGRVNCVDYACRFKQVWDMYYSPQDCIIIRNKNGNWHHLFIGIYEQGKIVCIEPATRNVHRFLMEDSWGSEYNKDYNRYGETYYWMGRCSGWQGQ